MIGRQIGAPEWSAPLDHALAYFLELRIAFRGQPEALAIIDRCLVLIARVEGASVLEAELIADAVEALRADLVARFGPAPPSASTRGASARE